LKDQLSWVKRCSGEVSQHYITKCRCIGLRKVSIHGLIKYKWSVYGLAFMDKLFYQVLKNLVVYVVVSSTGERYSEEASEHYYRPQCAQKMCIRGLMQ